jgi:NIPSNAP
MLLEIRRYTIVSGKRDEFVAWFESDALPVMVAAGMRIVGQFVSDDDPDAFFYLRSFADTDERDRQYAAVYGSDLWKTTLAPYALALETDARIEVVTPTAGSALR